MTSRLCYLRTMRALSVASLSLTVLIASAAARAEVGVLPTVVEGFEGDSADARRQQLDKNVSETLGASYIALDVKPGCELNPLPACIAAGVASSKGDIDEVAQVVLRRAGPNLTEMRLRIFGRDGVRQQELRAGIVDAEAVDATTALLRKAFDPSRYRGTVEIKGAPVGAELLIDGLPLEEPRAQLRVGKHVLDIVHPKVPHEAGGGGVETVSFEVAFERVTEVLVPSAPPPAGTPVGVPFWVATGTTATGILAISGGLFLYFVAAENKTEWARRAEGKTFPRNADDPLCSKNDTCIGADGGQLGWTEGYGPLGANGQVGQGARFMMVAFSRDNEERWESSIWAALGLGVAGTLATIGGVVGVVSLFPSDTVVAE